MADPCCYFPCQAPARWVLDYKDKEVGTVFRFACSEHLVDLLDKGAENTVRHIGLFIGIMEVLSRAISQDPDK